MSGGGSSTPQASPYTVDPTQLQQFLGTEAGKSYANTYKPGSSYSNTNGIITQRDPNQTTQVNQYEGADPGVAGQIGGSLENGLGGTDVTNMINAYVAWTAGNQQTKANWDNYSAAVSANEGGQGDNTITSGAAMGARTQALGSLNGTPATPPLGSGVNTLNQNGKPLVGMGAGK